MKIIKKNTLAPRTNIQSLNPGDTFEHSGFTYMCMSRGAIVIADWSDVYDYLVVCLDTGVMHRFSASDARNLKPVKAFVHVYPVFAEDNEGE